MVANEMRHDASASLAQNELVNVSIDTFRDGRNSFAFYINPMGIHADTPALAKPAK